ncbi:MAG: insulinase family protein [Lachnospiraceae bacterium]|nr:insulinase family protein [Lachnospiraceae bacterium]
MNLSELTAYELISTTDIKDINSTGYILKHKKTGARIMCIKNDDDNKVFYVGFRTPPEDSTGVPHIIEHSVLCGSEKYPAKDPFVELAKGSLNTFLNAMTYPDKTVYPVASCNDQDFKNLCDVYLDAAFHPNIYKRSEIFKQEGWHYEAEDENSPITLNGVVYSEMKGAFSSPDDVLSRAIFDSLFPDTCYGVESGGDPDVIPQLSYEEFLDFHRRYYHPSNSYIYLYGDVDLEERLDYIDREYLSKYDRLDIDSEVRLQKPFSKAAQIVKEYPVTNDEPVEHNTYLSYNTVVSTSLDAQLYIAFQVIEYALLSSPGAVLKQALLDSGICKDVQSTYENGIYQPYFSVIAKNSDLSDKDRFHEIIRTVLEKTVSEGYDKKSLLAAVNLFEFRFREADFGHYPKGLMYGLTALDSWLYDDSSPFIHICPLDTFDRLKELVETDYFEKLTKEYLLDNTHASFVSLVPVKGLTGKKDRELEEKLADLKNSMSDDEIRKLVEDTKALHAYQEEADDEEMLKCIPLLKISDIKKEAEGFINDKKVINGKDVLYHDIFTNGIGYLTVAFDLKAVPVELIPYVGILKSVLGLVNTANYSYADLANEIFLNSGGISATTSIYNDVDASGSFLHYFEIKAKILYDRLPFAFDMISEIVYTSDLGDKKRLRELIGMLKSRLSAAMMSSGHAIALHRALSGISKSDMISEMMGGISFYRLIEEIEADFDNKFDELKENLIRVSKMIFAKDSIALLDYTATSDQYDLFAEKSAAFIDAAPDVKITESSIEFSPRVFAEGFKSSAKVQYVAKAGKYISRDLPYTGALKVMKVIMGYDYLWNQVRVVGGAYGCFCAFSRNGRGSFASYRDPNLTRTLDVYNKAEDYLKNFKAGSRDMTKYIIGTISDVDFPLTPGAKGARSREAYLCNDSLEKIQKERDEILNCSEDDIRALSAYVKKAGEDECICVIGSEEEIEKEKGLFTHTEPLFIK